MVKISPEREIKVVHLQYGSSPSGNYTIRQHKALLGAGIDSNVLSLLSNVVGDPRIKNLSKKHHLMARLDTKIQNYLKRNVLNELGMFSFPVLGTDISGIEQVKEADYIYVHWVLNGFLSLKNMEQLARLGKPLIFVLHDMWNITGGCHHSFGCEKYQTGCYNCQMFSTDKEKDLSAIQYAKKEKFFSRYDNLFFVSPSEWLLKLSKLSGLTKGKPIFHIPNSIDTTLFKPFDKKVAKRILNIGEQETVLLFGANRIYSPYKGWKFLQKALMLLKEDKQLSGIKVLVFGSGPNKEIEDAIPFDSKFMGYIADDYTTNLVYNASDVFIVPSLADNFPTTILESMSCGTAVVGFNTGGIPEMIAHRENGYLANYKDEEDLAAGIKFCIENKIKGNLLPRFTTQQIVDQHFQLYDFINGRA